MNTEYLMQAKKHLKKSSVTFFAFVLATAVVMFLDLRGIALLGLSFAVSRRQSEFDKIKQEFCFDSEEYNEVSLLELRFYEINARNAFVIMTVFSVFSVLWTIFGGEIKGLVIFVYFSLAICMFLFWRKYRKKRTAIQEQPPLE